MVAEAEDAGAISRSAPSGALSNSSSVPVHVRLLEQRQRGRVLGQALAVEVGRVFLLQVRRVEQQDLGQLAASRGCSRCGREKPCLTSRGTRPMWSRCVWVSTTRVDARRVEGRLGPVEQAQRLLPLEHPGVDQQPPAGGLEQVLRAGDRLGRAEEAESWPSGPRISAAVRLAALRPGASCAAPSAGSRRSRSSAISTGVSSRAVATKLARAAVRPHDLDPQRPAAARGPPPGRGS